VSQYPQEYENYYMVQYQAMQWQSIFTVLAGIAVLVAMGAWALSLVRKAFKGEEVEFPL
jgi:uncharacterized membrane protein